MTGLILKTSPDLQRLAANMCITLTRHNGGHKGHYNHRTRTISTRRGMSIRQYRSTLAHELAHAHYGDTPRLGHYHQRQEQRADKWAANLLIDENSFFDAAKWCNGHIGEMAHELEVTQQILLTWIDEHGRRI